LLLKYFEKQDNRWQIKAPLKSLIEYRNFNLLDDFRTFGRFDVVFCRNVLIYFDVPTKANILARISKQMPDDGYLFLGGAETVFGVTQLFQAVPNKRGMYAVTSGQADLAKAGP
jgi:chemotaxis protein methyltransferase CheR